MGKIKILFLIMLILVLIGGSKKVETKKYTSDEIKSQMLDYVEKKYNEKFTMNYIDYGSWASTGMIMNAYPVKGNKDTDDFEIKRVVNGDDIKITDSYLGVLKREEYEDVIEKIVSKHFEHYKVYSAAGDLKLLSGDYDIDTDILTELKKGEVMLYLKIFVSELDEARFKDHYTSLQKEIKEEFGDVNFFVISLNNENLEGVNRENYDDFKYDIDASTSIVEFSYHDSW